MAGIVSLVLLPALFALDHYLPVGAAAGVAYVIPVLLTLWSPRRLTLAVAGIASLLVVADMFLSPAGTLNWMVVFNRALALLMVWVTAILVLLRRHAEEAVEVANAALERQVAVRTADDLARADLRAAARLDFAREQAEHGVGAAERRAPTHSFGGIRSTCPG